MTHDPNPSHDTLIPPQPLLAEASEFSERVHGMLDGNRTDEATVKEAFAGLDQMFDLIAAGLYSIASMLVGEGEQSIRLVETAVATADVSAGDNALQARKSSRLALCRAAMGVLNQREPGCLDVPQGLEPTPTCIEDDDLEAAGVSEDELARTMAGPDRDRVRTWLASLQIELRVIFVLRAVAGFTSTETAKLLEANGGPRAAGWTADLVRELFRQALCSLASQLIHAATAR
jgi:hypothetical protein